MKVVEDEFYRKIFQNSPDAVICVDINGKIIKVNQKTIDIFLYSREELFGSSIELLIPDRFKKGHSKSLLLYFKNPHTRPMGAGLSIIGLRKDCSEVELDISLNLIDDFSIATIRDISVISGLKKENEINSQMGALGILAAGMAHDINNPLAIINMTLMLIKKNKGDVVSQIDTVENAVARIAQIVQDLNNYSKSCSSDSELHKINLKEILEMSARLTGPETKYTTTVELEAEDSFIYGNTGKLVQVIINLIINAKHALSNHDVNKNLITLKSYDINYSYSVIEVSDNGSGIPTAIKNKIFDAFFTTKSAASGTGLGLSLAKTTVESMEGQIDLVSEKDKGTTFTLKFPRFK
jgi:PAS domain S-box-containing protein